MQIETELALYAVTQVGVTAAAYGALRADVKNLASWVRSVAAETKQTAALAYELKGRVESARAGD